MNTTGKLRRGPLYHPNNPPWNIHASVAGKPAPETCENLLVRLAQTSFNTHASSLTQGDSRKEQGKLSRWAIVLLAKQVLRKNWQEVAELAGIPTTEEARAMFDLAKAEYQTSPYFREKVAPIYAEIDKGDNV